VSRLSYVVTGTKTGEHYSSAVAELWTGLAGKLAQLDHLAADPDTLDDRDALARLQRLQYSLHIASEDAYGLEPPTGSESAHTELGRALGYARDATAEVAEALSEQGQEGVAPLVHEWRGALFRVRLARLRLATPPVTTAATTDERSAAGELARPLTAALLALGGALAFAIGAEVGEWPIWAAGLVVASASVLVYRP
jgi:hypothetical protein